MLDSRTVEKKTIELFSSKPADAISFRLQPKSEFTCYFDRSEWSKAIDQLTADSVMKAEYFSVLDSLQKTKGVIDAGELPICANDPKCLNPLAVSGKIIYDFMLLGHLSVQHSNGAYVKSLAYKKKIKNSWKDEEFKDSKTNKTVYTFSTKASPF